MRSNQITYNGKYAYYVYTHIADMHTYVNQIVMTIVKYTYMHRYMRTYTRGHYHKKIQTENTNYVTDYRIKDISTRFTKIVFDIWNLCKFVA